MTSVPFHDVAACHPGLVAQVVARLSQACEGLDAKQIDWHLVHCGDDPEMPLNETAVAELMLTGKLRGLTGVSGAIGPHFACVCKESCDSTK